MQKGALPGIEPSTLSIMSRRLIEPLSHDSGYYMCCFCCNILPMLELPRPPTWRRRRQLHQREPVPLRRQARSRRRRQRELAVAASGGGGIKTQWLTLFFSRTCKRGSNQAGARADAPGPVRGSRRRRRPGCPARAVGRAAAMAAAVAPSS